MNSKNDQIYIEGVLNGDPQAFAALVDRYKDLVFTLALRMLKSREEAEEVSQDTFIKVYKSLGKFKGDSKLSSWIYKVTYNTCLDKIKKYKRSFNTVAIDELTENKVKSIESALDELEKKERNLAIQHCIEQLPGDDSFILTLFYFEELSIEEIAAIVDESKNYVKVKLHRSRKKLAGILKANLEPEIISYYER